MMLTNTAVAKSQLPAGSVLQVVQAESTTQTSIASTTYTDGTNLNATITPTSATSKILVLVSGSIYVERATNAVVAGAVRILRDSTSIAEYFNAVEITAGVAANSYITNSCQAFFQYLDSPATTSATTYKLQGKANTTSNGAIFFFNASGGNSRTVITLMEIAA
jgi:hypothetical protein